MILKDRIQQLHDSGKMGNKSVYVDLYNSLVKFTDSTKQYSNLENLSFSRVDYAFLLSYETFLYKNNSASGISIKMRTLRALYNLAIKLKVVEGNMYPFNNYSTTQRLKSNSKHVAISKEQIYMINDLPLKPFSAKFEAQQYFLFSYYSLGMNLTDIANLKWSDIIGNKISYIRQKTNKRIICQK